MSRNSLAKYKKERLLKKAFYIRKSSTVFLYKKMKKSSNMVTKDTKIFQKMTNKGWLSIEHNIT